MKKILGAILVSTLLLGTVTACNSLSNNSGIVDTAKNYKDKSLDEAETIRIANAEEMNFEVVNTKYELSDKYIYLMTEVKNNSDKILWLNSDYLMFELKDEIGKRLEVFSHNESVYTPFREASGGISNGYYILPNSSTYLSFFSVPNNDLSKTTTIECYTFAERRNDELIIDSINDISYELSDSSVSITGTIPPTNETNDLIEIVKELNKVAKDMTEKDFKKYVKNEGYDYSVYTTYKNIELNIKAGLYDKDNNLIGVIDTTKLIPRDGEENEITISNKFNYNIDEVDHINCIIYHEPLNYKSGDNS